MRSEFVNFGQHINLREFGNVNTAATYAPPETLRVGRGDESALCYFNTHCILGDIRLWVGDPSTSSCLVSLPHFSQPTLSPSIPTHASLQLTTATCVMQRHYVG